jgi:hypothetical protein
LNSFEDNISVSLKDKREINLVGKKGVDNALLSIISNGNTLFSFPLRNQSEGYGNEGCIWLSPSESYLLFLYFTGESEEGFTLFKIGDELELVYDCCLVGEAGSYCFSEDEKWLIQFLPYGCDGWAGYEIDPEEDEDGKQFYSFGHINVLDIEKKEFQKREIRIYPLCDWQIWQNWEPKEKPNIQYPIELAGGTLTVTMPWGKEEIKFPLEEEIIAFRRNFEE